MTSQIGRFYLGDSETSWQRPKKVRLINVAVATLWWRLNAVCDRRPNPNETKMRRRYNVACRVRLQLEESKKFSLKTQCLSCQIFNSRSSNRKCSAKKLFLKISQISQENTCPRVFFNKVAKTCNFIKK